MSQLTFSPGAAPSSVKSDFGAVSPTDELKAQPVKTHPLQEFTQAWIKKYLTASSTERRKLLNGVFRDPNPPNENIVMKLKMDYVIDSNYSLLAFILYHLLASGGTDSEFAEYKATRAIAFDPVRSGFMESLEKNIVSFGYDCCHLLFDLAKLPKSMIIINDGDEPPSNTVIYKGTILSQILQVCFQPGTEVAPPEKGHIQRCESLIRVMLEQPTLSQDMKLQVLNQLYRPNEWMASTSLLDSIIVKDEVYSSLIRLLFDHGAEIAPHHIELAINNNKIEVLLEMLICCHQTNLLSIDLTTCRNLNLGPGPKYSTTETAAKRIIARIHQWQEEQQTLHLSVDANFQLNDASIRDWLRQQFSSLTKQLATARLQRNYMSGGHEPSRSRLIEQLRTQPESIRLFEKSNPEISATFLSESIPLFLHPEVLSHIPLVLTLFDERNLPLVESTFLFGTSDGAIQPIWRTLIANFVADRDPRTGDRYPPEEQAARRAILVQLFQATVKRLNQLNEVTQAGTNLHPDIAPHLLHSRYSEIDYDPSQDQKLLSEFQQSVVWVNQRIPGLIKDMVGTIGREGTIDAFRDLWLNVLPNMPFFPLNQLQCKCELIVSLVKTVTFPPGAKLPAPDADRAIAFLSDPILRTPNLFLPFKMIEKSELDSHEIRQVVNRLLEGWSNKEPLNRLFKFLDEFESDLWRTEVDVHFIHELSNLILQFLPPFSDEPTRAVFGLPLAPSPFTLPLAPSSTTTATGVGGPIAFIPESSPKPTATTMKPMTNTPFAFTPPAATLDIPTNNNPFTLVTTTASAALSTPSFNFTPITSSTTTTTAPFTFSFPSANSDPGPTNPFSKPFTIPVNPFTLPTSTDTTTITTPTPNFNTSASATTSSNSGSLFSVRARKKNDF